jgi:hypothetical protein
VAQPPPSLKSRASTPNDFAKTVVSSRATVNVHERTSGVTFVNELESSEISDVMRRMFVRATKINLE